MPLRAVPALAVRDLLCGQAEEEEVFFPSLLCHLDRCAVASPERQGPVHYELHVARPARLVSSRGDLIGYVGCGDQFLGKRHAVLGQKNNLETAAHSLIAVDRSGKVVEEFDNELRDTVRRRRLARKEESSRRHFETRVLAQPIVEY